MVSQEGKTAQKLKPVDVSSIPPNLKHGTAHHINIIIEFQRVNHKLNGEKKFPVGN